MIVTINTDASYIKSHKIAAFAFWIVCDDFTIKRSGVIRGKVESSSQAEMMSILNAFFCLFVHDMKKVSKIILNTDSMNCIHLISDNHLCVKKYKLGYLVPLLIKLNKMRLKNKWIAGIPIHLRHVKAHTLNKDGRSYVNEWCDRQAKAEIKKPLKTLRI